MIGDQFAARVVFHDQFAAEKGAGIQIEIQLGEDRTGCPHIYRDEVVLTDSIRRNPLAIQTESERPPGAAYRLRNGP